MELLLKTDPNCINVLDAVGASALIFAAEKGHAKIVKVLLDYGSDPNFATTDHHKTALHQAALGGFLDVVELLLDSRAESDPLDDNNCSPLWWAAMYGYHKLVKILLERNANPNVSSTPAMRRPIHLAAHNGHTEVVKLLLEAGAEPDEEDAEDVTPLWLPLKKVIMKSLSYCLELERQILK